MPAVRMDCGLGRGRGSPREEVPEGPLVTIVAAVPLGGLLLLLLLLDLVAALRLGVLLVEVMVSFRSCRSDRKSVV